MKEDANANEDMSILCLLASSLRIDNYRWDLITIIISVFCPRFASLPCIFSSSRIRFISRSTSSALTRYSNKSRIFNNHHIYYFLQTFIIFCASLKDPGGTSFEKIGLRFIVNLSPECASRFNYMIHWKLQYYIHILHNN